LPLLALEDKVTSQEKQATLEAGTGKKMASPLESKRTQPCFHLDFTPVRLQSCHKSVLFQVTVMCLVGIGGDTPLRAHLEAGSTAPVTAPPVTVPTIFLNNLPVFNLLIRSAVETLSSKASKVEVSLCHPPLNQAPHPHSRCPAHGFYLLVCC
jgi:hypothetical protein